MAAVSTIAEQVARLAVCWEGLGACLEQISRAELVQSSFASSSFVSGVICREHLEVRTGDGARAHHASAGCLGPMGGTSVGLPGCMRYTQRNSCAPQARAAGDHSRVIGRVWFQQS